MASVGLARELTSVMAQVYGIPEKPATRFATHSPRRSRPPWRLGPFGRATRARWPLDRVSSTRSRTEPARARHTAGASRMTDTPEYTPPKVWTNKPALGRFANINRPTAGAQYERELPVGKHPLQLYSLGTPNGVKVTIMLEELLEKGHKGAEYDAW